VALCVCGFLGLDTAGNSIPYLAVWAEDADRDAFERIAGLVDRLAPKTACMDARRRRSANRPTGRTTGSA
jgi:hypothetical protein